MDAGNSALARAVAKSAAVETPSPVRVLLATIVPVVLAAAFEKVLGGTANRWSVFLPAIFVCAWFGGAASGVAATLLSTAVMWWFFAPPTHIILKPDSANYLIALLFILTGIVQSGLLNGLRQLAVGLARNQRLLQGILDYSPSAIVIKDVKSRYVLVNKAFADLTGVKIEAALQHTPLDLFPRPLADEALASDKYVRETHAPRQFEANHGRGTDRYVLVNEFPILDESQNVFALGVIETDISQRKRDEEALRQKTEDLRAAQHVAHVGSWRWDFRTNQATWSDELYQVFGIDPSRSAAPLVNPGLKLLTSDSIVQLSRAIEQLRKDGRPVELDLEFTRPDGARRWCTARGEAVRDVEGQIIGITATAADITHIKELERLRHEWTSIIAHDLRQPIGVISMASEVMPELREGGKEQEQAMVRRIQSAAQTLKRMVDDLLDLSLVDAHRLKLERAWIDPQALVRETIEHQKPVVGNRVEISEREPTAPVFADPMRMEQVFGNLFSNAAKYGDPNTAIQVRLDRTDHEVRIAVTNQGKGIPAEELPHLFDRFVRSKAARGSGVAGLGLGLYIAKGIVEAHGGRLSVESEPGRTTTFHVTLPATATRAEAA